MAGISNRDILIWLNSMNIGNKAIERIIGQVPQLEDLWDSSNRSIYNLKNINNEIKEKIILNRNKSFVEQILNRLKEQNINVITILDKNYPERLYYIYDNPKVLYIRGDITEADNLAIAVVGSRKATAYGKWATEKLVEDLIQLGVTIVSGLAIGIDSAAHRKALECNGRTIGVLGNGLDTIYPKRNRDIYEAIPLNGAIVSEYFIGVPPLPHNFPLRNRIISGLSLGVIVAEAKERSGSLITAYHALEQGKEVFAIPGNINSLFSKGTNKLIKEGAKLIMDLDDVLEEICELQVKVNVQKETKIDYNQFSPSEIKVLEQIKEGPIHSDLISINTELGITTTNSILTVLEIKGIVKEMTGGIFTLS